MSASPKADAAPITTGLVLLRIRGFRSYGTEVREVGMDSPLVVIKGDNSQGKTATAEALEFLFTGSSSRRDLFGGAKAEYERMLANVHLRPDDADVWVEAEFRCPDGAHRTVRRTLDTDYSSNSECESTVTVDGVPVGDLESLELPQGDPPLAAPVLLQHNLRYVLSTEPQKRAEYFRALLELTDLDLVRTAVRTARRRIESLPELHWVRVVEGLREAVTDNLGAQRALDTALEAKEPTTLADDLVRAAASIHRDVVGVDPDGVIEDLKKVKLRAEEQVFPLGALRPDLDRLPSPVNLDRLSRTVTRYNEQIRKADAETARLAPIFEAVLEHDEFDRLSAPTECPVCAEGSLRPERVEQLREKLANSSAVQDAAKSLEEEARHAVAEMERVGRGLRAVLPTAQKWDDEKWGDTEAHLVRLLPKSGSAETRLDSDRAARGALTRAKRALSQLREVWQQVKTTTDAMTRQVTQRAVVEDQASALLPNVNASLDEASTAMTGLDTLTKTLHEELGESLNAASVPTGTREILDLLTHREELFHDLRMARRRQDAKKRMDAVERSLENAEKALTDARFDQMGEEIEKWWATLRPDEWVRFGGVGRRASGRRYVNLTATLAQSDEGPSEVRDAVGVFSDSQLNALGLASFLARQRLLKSPVVVLDDPLPGYDPDHRLTFAGNTLSKMLDEGVQVILLTHDPDLERDVVGRHQHRDPLHYKLSLQSPVDGTLVTDEGDFVLCKLDEAQGHLTSQTTQGRKSAATALRNAVERLAKQVIAAAQTADGTPTTVASLGTPPLAALIDRVRPHMLKSDEFGKWDSWRTTTNPGPHDDEPPSGSSLRVVLKEVREVRKAHVKRWPTGLPR